MSDEQQPDPRPGYYYVSAINDARKALIRGPFATHAQALAAVDATRELAYQLDHGTHWWAWGTARCESDAGPGAIDRFEADKAKSLHGVTK